LKLPAPRYVTNYRIAGQPVSGQLVELPGWQKGTVFDTESGEVFFDNYSDYTEDHTLVKQGVKQPGDDGRWGNIRELHRFVDEYVATELMLEAERKGDTFEYHGWDEKTETAKLELIHS
jgi:hypothetical protein